jgi:Flp pilus assembly protein TadG
VEISPGLSSMIRRLGADRSAGVAIFVALALPVIIGMAALGTEVSMWLLTQRSMQGAADAAASSAAFANTSLTTMQNQAYAIAAKNGYTNGVNGVTVTVHNPPTQGNFTTNSSAIEVVIQQTQLRLFSVLFLNANPVVAARAVAAPPPNGGGCLLALGSGTTFQASGNGTFTLSGCALDSDGSLSMAGNASVVASAVDLDGTSSLSGNASLTPTPITHDPTSFADPYLNRQNALLPLPSPCTTTFPSSGTVSQGCFKGGTVGGTVTMNPGIYYIDGKTAGLDVTGTLNATGGVTIFLTSSTPATAASIAAMTVSSNGTINITAPTTGAGAGLAIIQDDRASSSSTGFNASGNANIHVTGAMYFPNSKIIFSGNGAMSSPCLNLVALSFDFTGNGSLQNNCTGTGVTAFGRSGAFKLSE